MCNKFTKRCPECGEFLAWYSGKKRLSDNAKIAWMRCNNNHRWRFINDVVDRKVDVARGVKIIATRNGSERFPIIPGARNILGRCWSGSE